MSPQVELSGNFPAAPVSGPDAGDGFRIEIKDMEERTAAHNRAIDEFVRRRRPEQWFCLNSRESNCCCGWSAVLFTDRTRWRKDVKREIDFRLGRRVLLHFEYLFVKLFNYGARDYFHSKKPAG